MLGTRNLIIDTFSEVYNELLPYRDAEFWDFASHTPVPNSVYMLGRQQVVENISKFKEMAINPEFIMIFGNSAEGSDTLVAQIRMLKLEELVLEKKILLIGGGDMEACYPYLQYDHFINRILDYEENIREIDRGQAIFTKTQKPYQFLFLNGRARPHRKYLWERLNSMSLLDRALWTMLDSRPTISRHFNYQQDGTNIMATNTPLQWLPAEYEVAQYREVKIRPGPPNRTFIKNELFNNTWGEVYLQAEPYVDTYFSLVTETVFDYPYSFRTEKIAKPLAIGHPWIAATSMGFYKDMRNMGFKTFDGLIDESFDLIDNNQDRMDRIIVAVQDLCCQDQASFLSACQEVCKYNQQHLVEFISKIRKEFPERFTQFLNKYHNE
jgi:hypothetical protein